MKAEQLGNITLYNADCLEIMKTFKDKQFSLAIIDPPYGMPKDSTHGRGKLKNRILNNGGVERWDKAPTTAYFEELFRISANQIIWGGNYFDLPPTRGIICWDKMQPWENFSQIEYAWTSFNTPAKLYKFDNRTGDKIHPTQKPVQLYKWLLKTYAKDGDTILDTHFGSLSIGIACHDLKFDLTAIELDKDYYEAGKKKVNESSTATNDILSMKKKIDYKMLCDLIMVSVYEGETPEQALERVGIKQEVIPEYDIVSIKYHNGLLPWTKLQTNVKSLEELRDRIITVLNKTINLTIFGAKSPYRELMSPLYNFYVYASNLDKRDGVYNEADKIANVAWYGELARKRLEAQTDKMFSNTPSKEKFDAITKKIQSIWGFTDVEMDMFRYFVCQSRHKGHNPSLNKSIYLWAKQKRTGKTTIARAIVAVLNGEDDLMKAGKYESTLPREMQYNAHEIPVATTSNASILDEALFVDSTRSYPQIKQMLTSADVQLNIKYKDPVHMEAKRYYIFTSNDNITQFIQDEEERRFFEIQLNRVPTQITFEEIYEIWKEFCTNAEPEENWQEWYNSFEYVRGRASEEIDYYINQFRDDSSVLDLLNSMSQTYVTPPMIVKTMILGKATIKERTAVIGALDKLVGAPPPSRKSKYNRQDLIDAILDLRNGDSFEDVKVDNDIEVLPF